MNNYDRTDSFLDRRAVDEQPPPPYFTSHYTPGYGLGNFCGRSYQWIPYC